MGLFTVSISKEDRPRVDRAIDVIERLVTVLEVIASGQLVGRIEPKKHTDDIRK